MTSIILPSPSERIQYSLTLPNPLDIDVQQIDRSFKVQFRASRHVRGQHDVGQGEERVLIR